MATIAIGSQSDIGTLTDAIKTMYEEDLKEQIPHHIELLDWMGGSSALSEPRMLDGPPISDSVNTGFGQRGGSTWNLGLHKHRGGAAGARAEARNGATNPYGLPPSNDEGYDQAAVTMRMMYASSQVSHVAMKQVLKGNPAFINALDAAMTGPVMFLLELAEIYFAGDGTGILADITIPGGSFLAAGTAITVDDTKYLQVGMAIDIFDYDGTNWGAMGAGTGGTANGNPNSDAPTLIRITAVNKSNNTIKLDQPVHLTLGGGLQSDATRAVITNFGDCYVSSNVLYFLGPNGLDQAIDNGSTANATYQNINRGTAGNEFYHSTVLSASGGYDEVSHGDRCVDDIRTASRTKRKQLSAICTPKTRRVLKRHILGFAGTGVQPATTDKRRFDTGAISVTGDVAMISGVPLTEMEMVKEETLYFADKGNFEIIQNDDGQWLNEDGSVLARLPKIAAFGATFWWYCNEKCDRPNGGGKVIDIAA